MTDSTESENIDLLDSGNYNWKLRTSYNSTSDYHIPHVVNINIEHQYVHEGKLFQLSGQIASIAAAATVYFHGLTDSATTHFRAAALVIDGAPADVVFYEDADITANGTPVTAYNKNRNSLTTPTLQVFSAPTIGGGGVGTPLEYGLIPVTGPGNAGGAAALFESEWVLKPSTSYLISITNNDTVAIKVNYNFIWYEV